MTRQARTPHLAGLGGLLWVLALAALLPGLRPAVGGAAAAASGPVAVSIVEQTPWVAPGGQFAVRLQLAGGLGETVIAATVYPALHDPADVTTSAAGRGLRRALRSLPALTLPAGTTSTVLRIPVGPSEDGQRVNLDAGVYPVAIDVTTSLNDIGHDIRLVTHLVRWDPSAGSTRPVALVVPLDAAVRWERGSWQLDETIDHLTALEQILTAHPAIPFTLAPTPATLAALPATPGGSRLLAALSAAARHSQVLNAPFARIDAGAWAAAGLDEPLVAQMAAGEQALATAFGQPPGGSTWRVGASDQPLLWRWLAARGVRTFLVPSRSASPSAPSRETGPFRLAGLDVAHRALAYDSTSDSLPTVADEAGNAPLSGVSLDNGPPARAARLLARLALPAVDHESSASDPAQAALAPAVIELAADDPASRDLSRVVADAVDGPGPLRPASVDQAVATGTGGTAMAAGEPLEWPASPPAPTDLSGLAADLELSGALISSYIAAVGASDPSVLPLQQAVLALGAAGSDSSRRSGLVAEVTSGVGGLSGAIELGRDEAITVTAHRAQLPLTVRNRSNRPLRLRIELSSADLDLEGPQQVPLVLDAGQAVDLTIPVRVSRSGNFLLDVRVTTPDGRILVARRDLAVRSTVISGVGVLLSIGALIFLFGWWGRHILRTRRASPPRPSPHDDETDDQPAGSREHPASRSAPGDLAQADGLAPCPPPTQALDEPVR